MLFTHVRNKKAQDYMSKMEQNSFAEMTYQGRPIPKWLQEPAFMPNLQEKEEEILPAWLQEPAQIS